MRRGEGRKGWRKFWKNDEKTDEMDRKECRKMMKTNKGRRWKMKTNVGWGVCMKQFICGAWPSTTTGNLVALRDPVTLRHVRFRLTWTATSSGFAGRLCRSCYILTTYNLKRTAPDARQGTGADGGPCLGGRRPRWE